MAEQMETVIECVDINAMVAFFVDELGFRVELISPADDPAQFVIGGHDARLRLVRSDVDQPVRLRLGISSEGGTSEERIAPNGSVVNLVDVHAVAAIPENAPTLSIVQAERSGEFGVGRAGMGYRDLLPDRWGGRFIASHILIADGGDVADYVHFHRIRFQLIFVAAGWVDVVYEDQGEPFRMHAGDCVLQPPEIRHRVLRSSPGLEVIEIGCPAEHDTLVEHDLVLPTAQVVADRRFGGQQFVRHVAAESVPDPTRPSFDGFVHRDTGISAATGGLADARVLTMPVDNGGAPDGGAPDTGFGISTPTLSHEGEFAMCVVLAGSARLDVRESGVSSEARIVELGSRDAVAFPPQATWAWSERTTDFEMLQVVLPVGCIEIADA